MLSGKYYFVGSLCKTIVISGIILSLVSIFVFNDHPNSPASKFLSPLLLKKWSDNYSPPTDISHLVFGLVGSAGAWNHRKSYIEAWWRPNVTRGYVYLDTTPSPELLPWSPASPPLRISDDLSKFLQETKHVAPIMARMVHAMLEVFREGHQGVRWLVMGDDDSIFFVDNWVDVLKKYDHTKLVYIGGHSETLMSNFWYSFEQGFGGAGFAFSFPLVEALVIHLEGCLRRYPYLNSADLITKYCVDEYGVSLTAEKGIHQVDLLGDISGFLSSHPQSPLMSLHHLDSVNPIFPNKTRFESVNHLMKAAKFDQPRLLQQTICYHKKLNWSFSISWGYSTHIYESVVPPTILKKPLETFSPWASTNGPAQFLFNTRKLSKDPCEAPHVFYLESVESTEKRNEILTRYVRAAPRGLKSCSLSGNQSADHISKVQVFAPATKPVESGRSECCEIMRVDSMDLVKVKIRACMKNEIIAQ